MAVEGAAASVDQEIISWFEGVAENAGLIQTQTLRRIIVLNHGTEYLQKWLGRDLRVRDMDTAALESLFSSSVPLASHADHKPYIQRIADGDTSPLLTQEPITMLSLRLFPLRAGGRILEFIYGSKQFQTKGGLTVATATTHYFASEEFKTRQNSTESFYLHSLGGDRGGRLQAIHLLPPPPRTRRLQPGRGHRLHLRLQHRPGLHVTKVTSAKMRRAAVMGNKLTVLWYDKGRDRFFFFFSF